jgi:Holliday junction resolvasome RuvABC endonuclease subunit
MIAGIDYSMTCPAITVGPSTDFHKCKTFFYTDKTKYARSVNNIHGMMAIAYESEMERFDNLSEWAMTILKKFGVKQVCLEGYSMGSKGKVFNIAENGGLLKYKMWKAGIDFVTPPPTTVKKVFAGSGSAKKEDMHTAFVDKTGVDVAKLLDKSAGASPVSDVVDSYAMLHYYLTQGA